MLIVRPIIFLNLTLNIIRAFQLKWEFVSEHLLTICQEKLENLRMIKCSQKGICKQTH